VSNVRTSSVSFASSSIRTQATTFFAWTSVRSGNSADVFPETLAGSG
jgi:hypothetical protein